MEKENISREVERDTIIHGHVLDILRSLPDECVNVCITSPPYFGLRSYQTEPQVWGGDNSCNHVWESQIIPASGGIGDYEVGRVGNAKARVDSHREKKSDTCIHCNGWRGEIGQEPTVDLYISHLVEIFREVRRVLRSDGTLWLNLGDSMNNKQLSGIPWRVAFGLQNDGWILRQDIIFAKGNPMPESVKNRCTKSHEFLFLLSKARWIGNMPPRKMNHSNARWLALLVETEGNIAIRRWTYKRNTPQHGIQIAIANSDLSILEEARRLVGFGSILTAKGTNRPVFFLQWTTKEASKVLWEIYPFLFGKKRQAAIAIQLESRRSNSYKGKREDIFRKEGNHFYLTQAEIEVRDKMWKAIKSLNQHTHCDLSWLVEPQDGYWESEHYYFDNEAIKEDSIDPESIRGRNIRNNDKFVGQAGSETRSGFSKIEKGTTYYKRNKRSVWTINTESSGHLHFAIMPQALVSPCILAGNSAKGYCKQCGEPWVRITKSRTDINSFGTNKKSGDGVYVRYPISGRCGDKVSITTGWQKSCNCETDDVVPGLILDPFMGCYDTKTEVLTKDGFKFFSDIIDNEIVATINLTSHKLEYQSILQIHKYEYNGTMLHFWGSHTDLLVTPNHNMVARDRYKDYFELVPANNVRLYDELLRECNWDGHEITEFSLPCTILGKNQYSRLTIPAEVINMEHWVQFLGIYLSEGSTSNTYTQITQTKNVKKIIEILNKLPFKYKHYGKDFRIYDKRLREYLKQFGKQHLRFIPETIKSISRSYLLILLESLMIGDGHKFTETSWHYYTISQKLADDVSEIALKCGWSVQIKERFPRNSSIREKTIIGKHKQYEIHLSKKHGTPKVNHIKSINYHDTVWCLSVPNKTLVVRRNGKIIISGNSGTVALVAKKLGRDFIGIELNESYIEIAKERLASVEMPLFESNEETFHEQLNLFQEGDSP